MRRDVIILPGSRWCARRRRCSLPSRCIFADQVEMIDAAIANLAADPDDERSPDHRDVAVDLDRRVRDALLKTLAGLQAACELGPTLLAQSVSTAQCADGRN